MDNAKDKAEQRMKAWKSLPQPKVAWESFKRMVGQFGLEKAIVKATSIKAKK